MVKTLIVILTSLFLSLSYLSSYGEDKPVEAWIVKEKVNGKTVEVIKIKTESGKIYEISPTLRKEEIPKPVSTLPKETNLKFLYLLTGIFLILLIALGVSVSIRRKAR